MKIKKNDNIIVIAGSDKGKFGKVLKVFPETNKVIVDGINVRKIHKKKTSTKPGFILEHSAPINASNVMVQDPANKKATRIQSKMISGKKVRVATKSGQEIR
jgi:large subunit ribosomal protein L24